MKSFLEKLQSADENTKTRWIIVLTVAIMVVVIYVWASYFNTLIAGPLGAQAVASDKTTNGFGFWQTMKNGMATIYGVFMDKIRLLGNILNTPREYIVRPPQ